MYWPFIKWDPVVGRYAFAKRLAYVTTGSSPAQEAISSFVVHFDTHLVPPDKPQLRGRARGATAESGR